MNYLNDKYGWNGKFKYSDFLENDIHWNIQTKYLFFNHFGSKPRGEITNEIINNKLTKNNILKISKVVDIFIETKNLSKFIDTMSKYFNLNYNSKLKFKRQKYLRTFNDNAEKLLNNNKFDCFLLKTYMNDKNNEFNI